MAHNRYLFVDFPTVDEAHRARQAVDGKFHWGMKVRGSYAKVGGSCKVDERRNRNLKSREVRMNEVDVGLPQMIS